MCGQFTSTSGSFDCTRFRVAVRTLRATHTARTQHSDPMVVVAALPLLVPQDLDSAGNMFYILHTSSSAASSRSAMRPYCASASAELNAASTLVSTILMDARGRSPHCGAGFMPNYKCSVDRNRPDAVSGPARVPLLAAEFGHSWGAAAGRTNGGNGWGAVNHSEHVLV